MSLTLTFSDDALRQQRSKRIVMLIRGAAWASVAVCAIWLSFALARGFPLVVVVETTGILASAGVLLMLRRGRLNVARHLAMGALFLLIASIIALEGNSPGSTPVVHLYLICLAVGAYLIFFDAPPVVPAGYAGACFLLFVTRELGWLRLPRLGPDDRAVDLMATHTSFIALFVIVLLLTRLFVASIAEAERHLASANERLEVLLESLLPESVARRLREQGHTFADNCDSCTILFADIVGFTQMAAHRTPAEIVALLDDLFSRFDILAEKLGAEKIKTLGDAYVAVAGVPVARSDHAAIAARLALAMQHVAAQCGIAIRVGINTGPVVAGVIGKKRFIYDLWGDAVSVAADMEASAAAGGIQATASTRDLLGPEFALRYRGEVDVRGGRRIGAWLLEDVHAHSP